MKEYEETRDSLSVALQGGQYWRAVTNITDGNDRIKKGTVLLLESVRDVEGEAHTVIVRPHPDEYARMAAKYRGSSPGEYRFLVQDFLKQFVLEPDYKRIRDAELAQVQGRVTELQKQLAEANTNPEAMKEHVNVGVNKWAETQKILPEIAASLPDSVQPPTFDQTLTVDKVENMKLVMAKSKEVASLRSGWITEKVQEIGKTVEAMTPYYQEQAAAALAMTEDVRTHVAKLMTGIESLDLYVGTNVEVTELRKGKDAPIEIPLTIMQKKLFMDQELSAWCDIGKEFDFRQKDLFYKALVKHESLVQQVFPTERCIVCMAVSDDHKEYSDNPWVNAKMNEINKNVFLLVRNGENIHLVHSPVESHTKSSRLFPSQQEMEDIFTEKRYNWETRDYDRERITFQDVQYTDKLTKFEAAAVHYKRFLVLLAGLDHRLNLFGAFYTEPKGMNFMTLGFQQKYLHFIHDDDGTNMLPLVDRPDFNDWVKTRNAYLRSGSRVMCMWHDVMTPQSAPGAVKESSRNNYFRAEPKNKFGVVIAYRDGKEICVRAPVQQSGWSSDREFEARVSLTVYDETKWQEIGYLVLDAVKADDLETYIHDRVSRADFLSYIRLFKAAVNYLREDAEQEAPTRKALCKALEDGYIAGGERANEIVDKAVIAWRSINRGAKLCKPVGAEYTKLWNQMYLIAKGDQDWQEAGRLVEAEGRKPLRFVLAGNNKLSIYATPLPSEVDDRLFPMPWVMNIVLTRSKTGVFKEVQRRWLRLPAATSTETTLHEWNEAQAWRGRPSPIERFEQKQHLFEMVSQYEHNDTMLHPMEPEIWDLMFAQWEVMRHEMALQKHNRFVQNPSCYVPIGLEYHRQKNRLRIVVVGTDAHILLYLNAPDRQRKQKIASEYAGRYSHSDAALARIKEEAKNDKIVFANLDLGHEPEANGFCRFGCTGVYDWKFNFQQKEKDIRRIIATQDKNSIFNNAPTKLFWIPSLNTGASAAGE